MSCDMLLLVTCEVRGMMWALEYLQGIASCRAASFPYLTWPRSSFVLCCLTFSKGWMKPLQYDCWQLSFSTPKRRPKMKDLMYRLTYWVIDCLSAAMPCLLTTGRGWDVMCRGTFKKTQEDLKNIGWKKVLDKKLTRSCGVCLTVRRTANER